MTLAELKAAIAGLPDDTEVLIANPEWGPCSLLEIWLPGVPSRHEITESDKAHIPHRLLLED